MDRILAATEELLADREFEAIGVQEIVARAGSSVGAFYNRFRVKDALLPYLLTRHLDEQLARARDVFDGHEWRGRPLVDRVGQLFHHGVLTARARSGLYRTLVLRRLARPDELSAAQLAKSQEVTDLMVDWLLARRLEMSHPDPDTAVRLGVALCFNTLHAELLHPKAARSRAVDVSDARLARELTRAFLAYVGHGDPATVPDLTAPPAKGSTTRGEPGAGR